MGVFVRRGVVPATAGGIPEIQGTVAGKDSGFIHPNVKAAVQAIQELVVEESQYRRVITSSYNIP